MGSGQGVCAGQEGQWVAATSSSCSWLCTSPFTGVFDLSITAFSCCMTAGLADTMCTAQQYHVGCWCVGGHQHQQLCYHDFCDSSIILVTLGVQTAPVCDVACNSLAYQHCGDETKAGTAAPKTWAYPHACALAVHPGAFEIIPGVVFYTQAKLRTI